MQKGKVHGPFLLETIVCETNYMLTSKGVFFGSDPLKYALPLLLLQMAAIILTSRLLFRLLKPLKQGMISAQVLVMESEALHISAIFFVFIEFCQNVYTHAGWYNPRTVSLWPKQQIHGDVPSNKRQNHITNALKRGFVHPSLLTRAKNRRQHSPESRFQSHSHRYSLLRLAVLSR